MWRTKIFFGIARMSQETAGCLVFWLLQLVLFQVVVQFGPLMPLVVELVCLALGCMAKDLGAFKRDQVDCFTMPS